MGTLVEATSTKAILIKIRFRGSYFPETNTGPPGRPRGMLVEAITTKAILIKIRFRGSYFPETQTGPPGHP